MSTYLVTGAAGFIGSHLCAELQRRGDRVRGVDSFTDYYARALKDENITCARSLGRFELFESDLASGDLGTSLDGVDGIFHLAAQPGVRASWGNEFDVYLHDNLLATQRVFREAVTHGLRVVYASSSSVYGDAERYPTPEDVPPRPISPYGITKLACEHLARSFARAGGLDAIGLRYFTVFGARQRPDMAFTRLARAAVRGDHFELLGDGEQSRDFTYVGDAVAATIAAMDWGCSGATYNVGGGAETTLNHVIQMMEKLSGNAIALRRRVRAAGDVRRTASETTRIRQDVGWAPKTTIRDGLLEQLEWVRSREQRVGTQTVVYA